ncbi:MAG TPA: hypothetical protein V6D47_02675 [Oscillatoriaceae cyanobacterium]
MDISFRNKKLQKLCNTQAQAFKDLGSDCGKRLLARMVQLKAVDTLADMEHLPGRLHALHNDRAGQYAVDLKHPQRLILVPAHDPVPVLEDGGVDLSAVTAIEIIEIVDYH